MEKPLVDEVKVVSPTPIVLQCGPPMRYPLEKRNEDHAMDIVEVCAVFPRKQVWVEWNGQRLMGFIPYATCSGEQCFVCTGTIDRWFPTKELQRLNYGFELKNIPGDGRLGVKGMTLTVGAMILSAMIMRGCDHGSKLVLPRDASPAIGPKQ